MVKVLILIALCLVATVRAELGAECQVDTDCDGNEFCLMAVFKAKLMVLMMGEEAAKEMMEKKMEMAGEGADPMMGSCHPKSRLYEPCLMDNMCETDRCMSGPLPGMKGPKWAGRCVECANDGECSTSEYCSTPVINAQCKESLMLGLALKKTMDGDMSYGSGYGKKKKDDDEEDMKDPGKMIQKVIEHFMEQFGVEGPKDMKMPPGFPPIPRTRNKRNLGHFLINAPKFTCMTKKPTNSPCRRSLECQSNKCTVEGSCAV